MVPSRISIDKVSRSGLPGDGLHDIPFGRLFADHMFIADYREDEWKDLRIIPYGRIQISPGSPALHYGQSIFEGMKAYYGGAHESLVFRPRDNWKRLKLSAERMSLAPVPEEIFMEGLSTLISLDRSWIPNTPGGSLYIRPFLFSGDEYIGIRPSHDVTFMIITSPAGVYYSSPVRVKIETRYTRAIAGGTGFAKAGGNYGGAIYPSRLAQEQGYHQLLWTDGKTHQYIEESGTMNVMFVIGDKLVTPSLSDSILAGITRDSVLTLARHWGMVVEERKISVEELIDGLKKGNVSEAFGTGTAATIAPISAIGYEGMDYPLPTTEKGAIAASVFIALENIKRSKAPDPFHWVERM
jgi:branched-chain amino acid aminotransferase